MNLTKHANVRCQQRAIPPLVVDLLIQFGCREQAGNGCSMVFLDKGARRKLESYVGSLNRQLEEHLDVYLVVDQDNVVITVAHLLQRIRRH